jgi:hypothetical protein
MLPEYLGSAGASDKRKRPFRMIVNGRIEFTDYVVKRLWRRDENRTAITAIRRVADAICRSLREKDRMIDVGGHASPAEMLSERAVTHQDYLAGIWMFFISRAAATDAAAVVANADERALVKRPEGERVFVQTRHARHHTKPLGSDQSVGKRRIQRIRGKESRPALSGLNGVKYQPSLITIAGFEGKFAARILIFFPHSAPR